MFQLLRSLLAGGRSGVPSVAAAVAEFQRFEQELRDDFFALAARSGKPRGLRWITCEWPDDVLIVAERDSQLISAYASVNVGFEAVEGGDMEDVQAVSTIRDGAAIFHYSDSGWGSAGRVAFNLSPVQAAGHLAPAAETVFHRTSRQ